MNASRETYFNLGIEMQKNTGLQMSVQNPLKLVKKVEAGQS